MWLILISGTLIDLSLKMLPVIGSYLYFKRNKEPHAQMLLWGSVMIPVASLLQDAVKFIILPRIGDITMLQAILFNLTFPLVGTIGFLFFGIGFILLIKKIIKHNQPSEPT